MSQTPSLAWQKAHDWQEQADELAAQGRHQEALELLAQARHAFRELLEPTWITYLGHRQMICLEALGRRSEALALAAEVRQGYQSQGNLQGLVLFLAFEADLHLHLDGRQEALFLLHTALDLAKRLPDAGLKAYLQSHLAIALVEAGLDLEAIAALDKALNLYRQLQSQPEAAWCLEQLGLCYHQIYLLPPAENCLSHAYKLYLDLSNRPKALEVMAQLKSLYQESLQESKRQQMEKLIRQVQEP